MRQLTPVESDYVRNCVEKKYAPLKGLTPLWECLEGEASKYDPEGWKAIGEFPFKNKVTIFFDKENEPTMYSANNCNDVVELLSECPGFVFYITDDNYSFLLCHNDHDYLIGAGTAADWVSDR